MDVYCEFENAKPQGKYKYEIQRLEFLAFRAHDPCRGSYKMETLAALDGVFRHTQTTTKTVEK
jgi:hypothetical protein